MVLFVFVCIGAYLNLVGLPGFVKRPLLASLRNHGVELEFSRLRLRGYRGIVAEKVRLAGIENPAMPKFTAESADVKLNCAALALLSFDVKGVTLNKGTLRWVLNHTNEPPNELVISNLMATVRFLPGDRLSLDQLQADCLGARFSAVGEVTNASLIAAQLRHKDRQPPEEFMNQLRRIHGYLERITFERPPEFRLSCNGDAQDFTSFNGLLTVDAPDATSAWGEINGATLTVRLTGRAKKHLISTHATLKAAQVKTVWASCGDLYLDSDASQTSTNEIQCMAVITASSITGNWVNANRMTIRSEWSQQPNDIKPHAASLRITGDGLSTRWASADALEVQISGEPTSDWMAMDDPALDFWNHLLPYTLKVSCTGTNLTARELHADNLGFAAWWDAPRLTITNLHGDLAEGRAELNANLDVLTRRLAFDSHARLDFHQLSSVLTEKSREWLKNFAWEKAPIVDMAGTMTLPVWTNRAPDWRGKVQPTIVLNGSVFATYATYRGIATLSANTHLNYSNRVWHLPDLVVVRPEGRIQAELQSNEISHEFAASLRGQFDPRVLPIKAKGEGHHGLEHLESKTAPWLEAQIRGNWYAIDQLWARADVAWTNFSYRSKAIGTLNTSLEYSNRILLVLHPRVERDEGFATADGLKFDFDVQKAYLTNGYTTVEPMAIAWIIGPKTAAAVTPYQFLKPPEARVHGVIPLKGEKDADLHFEVLKGGPFHWAQFKVPSITGQVLWANESVTLTNIVTSFYGGEAEGNAWFDVSQHGNSPFQFALTVTNADLHALMSDLHSPTNQLEGALTGSLTITNANTADWKSWNGYGNAQLRDGLIWDTPIFGMMSPILNTVMPGIGNSRASEAGGTFSISNSVIHTSDLDIRASGMRLIYNGTVDFQTRVNARVEAELLRDTWFVGRLVSAALWPVSKLFEYEVTGTLANPKPEPLYLVPRLVLMPLHPVQSFKDMLQPTEPEGNYDALPDYLMVPDLPAETPTPRPEEQVTEPQAKDAAPAVEEEKVSPPE